MALLNYRKTTKWKLDNVHLPAKFGRPYLGMSSVGEPCLARRWYDFHWCSKKVINPRKQRIFDVGHLFESIAIKELKQIGIEVYKMVNGVQTEMTGAPEEDQETLMGFYGHVSGHSDGRAKGFIEFPNLEMLLELKTMKDVYFKRLKKMGVRETQPKYYAQIQRYMREKKLLKCFFLAINKNNCEYYPQFIDYDKSFAEDLVRRETTVIMSDSPLPKHYIEGYFECNMCDHIRVCHRGVEPEMNCRTCKYVDIAQDAQWLCTNSRHNEIASMGRCEDEYSLTVEEQQEGCSFYVKGWNL